MNLPNIRQKKRSLKLLVTSCLALSLLNSCRKEYVSQEPLASGELKTLSGQSINYRPLNTSDADLLVYAADANLEKIDMAVYAFGNVFKGLLTQNIVDFIVAQSQSNPNGNVPFSAIFSQFPGLESSINTGLANQSINVIPYDFSTISKINVALQRNGITYELGVNVPNLGSFGSTASFILTPGIELEDEANHDDQIMGWLKQGNTTSPIRLDENEAMAGGTVLIDLNLNPIAGVPIGGSVPIGPPTGVSPGSPYTYINIINIRPWFKFEKKGNSEIWLHAATRLPAGAGWTPTYSGYGKKLVSTDNMGNWHLVNVHITFVTDDVIWNIYERDWYAANKMVNQLGGTPVEWGAPMKFYGEVYGINPAENYPNNIYTPAYMGTYKSTVMSNMPTPTYLNGFNGNANMNFNAL